MVAGTIEGIKAAFEVKAVDAHRLFLLSPADAAEYVAALHRAGVPLLGVEGFQITPEGAYQPLSEWSNDVADQARTEDEFIQATLSLMAAAGQSDPSVYFQVLP